MDPDDSPDEDAPLLPWLPPDDRLWRHPSELASSGSPTGPYRDAETSPGEEAVAAEPRRSRVRRGVPKGGGQDKADVTAIASSPTIAGTLGEPSLGEPSLRDLDRRLWSVAVLAGVVGALVATSAVVVVGQIGHPTTVVRPIEQLVAPASTVVTVAAQSRGDNIGTIATRLRPTIVELLVNSDGSNVVGSGVIFSSDGYVLTDEHIVQGAQSMVAVLSNGQRIDARLVGGDQTTDIAVVKLQGGQLEPVATLGSSAQLQVGQMAITLGSPNGPAVTSGIISALDSRVDPADGPPLRDMIQTDAAMEPGSNGGALVDATGMVVGITTTVSVGNEGMENLSFATPIEIASDVANQLIQTGHVVHAWLGIEGADLDPTTAQEFGISGGVIVTSVDADSPAARVGVVASEVITSFAGQAVQSMSDLDDGVRHHHPGDRVHVTYLHHGEPSSVEVVLGQQPTYWYP